MTTQIQRRRGTDTQHGSFTGAEGELSVNTTNKSVHVHDGATAGGFEAARADLDNVSDADLNSALTGNTLSSLTITSADINGGTIDGTVIGGSTPAAGSFTNITATGTVDGRDVAADGTKLDGIEASADVTDTANVTAAGALMDSELADIAAVKALDQGVATTDDPTFTNTQLAEIASTISDTAVDVFVYDTSKDSDGGAWRRRTQHTSWYNETLNTATRGSRKEFPSVAVIVVHSLSTTGKVTIYDGDDPSLPMWMVLSGSSSALDLIPSFSGTSLSCVSALNGIVMVGNGTYDIDSINFVEDAGYKWSNSSKGKYNGNIEQRADGLGFGGNYGSGIVNRAVNDVAMTVLPNAPIDAATGLPVPTIAVATDGGVSVIKDDGNVWDITGTNWMLTARDLSFVGSDLYFVQGIYTVLAVDVNDLNADLTGVADNSNTPPLRRVIPSGSYTVEFVDRLLAVGSKDYTIARPVERGGSTTDAWLNLTKENTSDFTKGMSAFVSADFNTGWMNGDIKGAFLSDTDDTDLVGSGELVTNGTFDTDISGWTADGSGSIAWDAGTLKYTGVSTGPTFMDASQTITTVVGKVYCLSFEVTALSPPNEIRCVVTGTSNVASIIGTGVVVGYFTATQASTLVQIGIVSGVAGETFNLDNVSVRLAEEDRSVNGSGLQVFGTVTKNPVATGADLVAYSGFSSSNYLEQPYNSDLDFGTGDFCVMGWIDLSNDAYATIFHKGLSNTVTGLKLETYLGGSNYTPRVYVGTTSIVADSPFPASGWFLATVLRRSGVVEIWANGQMIKSAANSSNVENEAGQKFRLGVRHSDLLQNIYGSLALFRISATAPTAEQIARIYNDEKHLFTEGAQATLYGSSDAVTALAYDTDTELLHVGTSAGRSVFQGLRRVDNTTTAVGTAISASNGMIVEE